MADTADLVAFPQQPSDRLRLALRRLETALAEQAEAVADFRQAMGELRSAVDGLSASVGQYQTVLSETQQQCVIASETARAAEATADTLLARLH